jgi:hypothetical protein
MRLFRPLAGDVVLPSPADRAVLTALLEDTRRRLE